MRPIHSPYRTIIALRNMRQLAMSFLALMILFSICQRSESAVGASTNLLTTASIESVSSNDTKCCVGGTGGCSSATLSPLCAFDDNSSSVWTLSQNQLTVTLTLKLTNSAILDRLEVSFSLFSVIPNSLIVTAFNQEDADSDLKWTTYFNKTCQPDDAYLRKQDSQYYSCLNYRSSGTWIASLPTGLLSVQDVNGGWRWWRTFQKLQMTVAATNDDYSPGNGAIAITDIRLYGWNPPSVGCNCHPTGVKDISDPCDQNGNCKCRSSRSNDQCQPSTDIMVPDFGPVSGGTLFVLTGNFFSLLSKVTIGNVGASILSGNDTQLKMKTTAGNAYEIGRYLPILLHFNQSNIPYSFIIADSEFVFGPDPIVTSITPKRTISSGGIMQTVFGRNLDSVAFPFIIIVSIMKSSGVPVTAYTTTSTKPTPNFCQTINSTMLTCLTPAVPDDRINSDNRFNVSVFLDIDSSTNYTQCQSTDGKCDITVAHVPEIYEWKPGLDDPVGFPYYNGKRTKNIDGQYFQYGGPQDNNDDYTSDYKVTVGGVQCEILSIINNLIIFEPPDPKLIDSTKKQPAVLFIGYYYNFTVGNLIYYLNWIDDPANRNPLIGGLIGGIGGVIVVAIIIFLIIRYKNRLYTPVEYIEYTFQNIAPYFPEDIEKYSVDFGRIEIQEGEIGKGNFGKVSKGTLMNLDGTKTSVAIKTLHNKAMRFEDKVEFLQEAMVMADFCHDHVLGLIAISIHKDKPYVILPLMEHGDLRGFVSKDNKSFTAGDLVNYSVQVAKGMEYLAIKKFVHRDLAARNCMINQKLLVKVADFGLARDIFEKDYYRSDANQRPLPVKWMALECLLNNGQFTEKSDVWSYGVLVWELMTRGRKPYSDVDPFYLRQYLERGNRLEKPNECPDFMYSLMKRCWQRDRNLRPTFKQIVEELEPILSIFKSGADSSDQYDNIDDSVVAEVRRTYLQLTPN